MHPLAGSRAKIERAREHIADLEAQIARFGDSEPFRIVRETEEQTGEPVYRFRIQTPLPIRIALTLGDAIHNLRSALDHLAYQLVIVNGAVPTDQTAFPIGNGAEKYESLCRRRLQGASVQAMSLCIALEPHRDGNKKLWQIHRLDVRDKHCLLIPVGTAHTRTTIDTVWGRVGRNWPHDVEPVVVPMDRIERPRLLNDGDAIQDPVSERHNPKYRFDVAFNEPEIIQRTLVTTALGEFVRETVRVVDLFAGGFFS